MDNTDGSVLLKLIWRNGTVWIAEKRKIDILNFFDESDKKAK